MLVKRFQFLLLLSLSLLNTRFIFAQKQERLVESNAGEITVSGEDELFITVEEMPEFPGGQSAFMSYLAKEIKYPENEKEEGIQGTVYISFVIRDDGKVSDAKVERGIRGGEALDKEALRVITHMPTWKPGKHQGKNVNVKTTIPIKFFASN